MQYSDGFYFRLCKADFTEKVSQKTQEHREYLTNSHLLIVSDDHIFCTMLSNILIDAGCQVSRAFSGEFALKLLNENPYKFDLIILDNLSLLPSWLYLLDRLSTIPIIEKIPLIVLANKTETFYVSTAIRYAAFDILYKPIEDHMLLGAINSALHEKKEVLS